MPDIRKGSLDGSQLRLAIVMSRFNSLITDRLLRGALRAAAEAGVSEGEVEVIQVPGAYEVPLFTELVAARGHHDAIISLGAIIRGETQHHEYLGHAIFDALQRIQIRHRVPIAVGILTTENMDQAMARSGDDPGNKGYESVMTAIECANLRRSFP
jgi:6,7-dimethyl-8-ribityllumazine synthase